MFDFPKKRDGDSPREKNGKTFLADAKREHAGLFEDFVTRAGEEEFESFSDFLERLQQASWELCEAVAKQSYRNGINRGRSGRSQRQ